MKKKLNFYDYFWIFFAGSFIGVVIEEFYWLIKTGLLESRQGLVYGPFNLVYGFGALILTFCLNSIKKSNKLNFKIFIISFIMGSLFEYFCSIFQEELFGTVSWEYSEKLLNINGRITLQYSIFWGILGIIWIRYLLPLFIKTIDNIPLKANHILTYVC
ncbi:MAG TPA: putative ABC transporter permease, partial [Bacilli bacterium]|nr:putative ABC transporter permease [Bacilli bacterium]